MRCLVALIALVAAAAAAAAADPAARLFSDSCSVCHTIGGGDGAGPDLVNSAKLPHGDLEAAVRRMEVNVGPLTDEQVDGLVALLQASDAGQRLAALDRPAVVVPKGSPETGRRLFFGQQKLANGGSPCFACHAIGGTGGNLAVDLTTVHKRRAPAVLLAATVKPAFPMMKAAYARTPVTDAEALDLVAFFEASAAAPARAESVAPVRIAAVSFAGVILGGLAFVFRSRRAGVRSRLVSRAGRKR